jgi:hypothetical protein
LKFELKKNGRYLSNKLLNEKFCAPTPSLTEKLPVKEVKKPEAAECVFNLRVKGSFRVSRAARLKNVSRSQGDQMRL